MSWYADEEEFKTERDGGGGGGTSYAQDDTVVIKISQLTPRIPSSSRSQDHLDRLDVMRPRVPSGGGGFLNYQKRRSSGRAS